MQMAQNGPASEQVRVACIQMEPKVGENAANLARSLELCEEAVRGGAQLLVLPELCNSGYVFETRGEAQAAAEEIPTGAASSSWIAFCRERGVYLVAGICERAGEQLFNSSIVIGPDGYIGTFRKVHLWNRENLFFEPGDLGFPVFHTAIGRIATFICYDGWFPEAYRACALRGADIICIPTNWVPIPGQAEGSPAMATVLAQANAHSNSVYIAAADRVGTERGQPFNGQSVIVSYTGWPLAGPASPDDEEILYADLDLGMARVARNWNDFNPAVA
ncbi:nitrilase family protein [Nocardioides panacis]|uniref:Nitrilase family protein n=1 Tax=Nocardioides panacis TaxID=2849501 RepID=A0A975T207_9ACTN|nr:nitrilase family protein [Nocardioides panacis]QWZ10139.1 nitrilase family protein [Nocardioides panacis]